MSDYPYEKITDEKNDRFDRRLRRRERRDAGRPFFGLILLLIGIVVLLREFNLLPSINWVFHWPYILIGVGLLIGVRSNFRKNAWWILILIGGLNLIPAFTFHGVDSDDLAVPALLIGAGAIFMLRGKKKSNPKIASPMTSNENTIDFDVAFSGRKEFITSRDFQGGSVSATFGGAEINLIQADIANSQPAVLSVRATFGGVELTIPSHWEVKNEVEAIFGSVEDERRVRTVPQEGEKKVLILRGSCVFGGVEIKSY